MKRLELGDDYHSSDTEESKSNNEDQDEDYNSYFEEESQLNDNYHWKIIIKPGLMKTRP